MMGWREGQTIVALLVLSLLSPLSALATDGFTVIVNRNNPVSSLSRERLVRIFTGKETSWPDGIEIRPVDLISSSSARARFTRDIHGKRVNSIKRYWQKQIFTGRAVPPPEKSTDRDVVEFVKTNRGAIGYVSRQSDLRGLRAVKIER